MWLEIISNASFLNLADLPTEEELLGASILRADIGPVVRGLPVTCHLGCLAVLSILSSCPGSGLSTALGI